MPRKIRRGTPTTEPCPKKSTWLGSFSQSGESETNMAQTHDRYLHSTMPVQHCTFHTPGRTLRMRRGPPLNGHLGQECTRLIWKVEGPRTPKDRTPFQKTLDTLVCKVLGRSIVWADSESRSSLGCAGARPAQRRPKGAETQPALSGPKGTGIQPVFAH